MPFDTDPQLIVLVALILLLGATVKGAMGIGMPLVSIPLLSLLVTPPLAIALLAAPILASNAMQIYETKPLGLSIKRMGLLLLVQTVSMVVTVRWTASISPAELNKWLGLSIFLTAALLMFKPSFHIPAKMEPVCSVFVGLAAGFVGGVSSMTGPVVIAYLIALRMRREEFIGTISTVYLLTALPMYAAMLWFGRFGLGAILLSLLALPPMFLGMHFGKQLRQHLDEQRFRRILIGFLLAMAATLFFKS